MYILGINAFHADSSACLMKNGEVINAIEEERIKRVKHWAGFPIEAIKFCLDDEGISISDIDHITISRNPKANLLKKAAYTLIKRVRVSSIYDRLVNSKKVASVKSILSEKLGVSERDIKAKIHNVEHHRSHMASAFYVSPFEESAILSVDGFGDFSSTMLGIGRGNKIEVLANVFYPHSLGVFYTAFTQFLGFQNYGDEYKVMGLAAYGSPVYEEKLKKVIFPDRNGLFRLNEKYFRHPKEGVAMVWEKGTPEIGTLYSKQFITNFGEPRDKKMEVSQYHKDLAASVQKITENIIFHLLNVLHEKTGLKNLCIAGGVAQNSVANGKVITQTPFKKLYIPSAGHDAGTCMGSALFLYHDILNNSRCSPMYSASLGSKFSNDEIKKLLSGINVNFHEYENFDDINNFVTDCIINGGVVGWFQGRAEFGPRALGNRSILADPRRGDARDLLNIKIKRRESFRPFAPSILKEFVGEYFELDDEVPFMEKVFVIKKGKRKMIPAVTHVDGTGRLQTVNQATNPKYYALIKRFYEKSGVPLLLNTSFNENEPIVNHPEEAIDCFLRTQMDMLVMENIIITRVQ